MKKFITLFIRHWSKSPGKVSLTLFSVALGTGILILSLSASTILKKEVTDKLETGGVILYVANGSWASDGTIDQKRPGEWDMAALDLLVSDIAAADYAVPIMQVPFNDISVKGKTYRLRSAIGTGPEYFDIFSLETAAGIEMTSDDIESGARSLWISEETAVLLFGSPEAAIGEWISPPGMMIRTGPGPGRPQNLVTQYSVKGVYKIPSELARRSYGIGDVLFPYTSLIPSGSNAAMMRNFLAGAFAVKGHGISTERFSASIRQTLSGEYGEDIEVLVWEGTPQGISAYMKELRQTVDIFTVSVNILGMVLLLTSSLGIFSIMVVEALGRKRDIALERALGASRGIVVREFWSWSMLLSSAGALIGFLLALGTAGPVLKALDPLLGEVAGGLSEKSLTLPSVLLGFLLALGCGGVMGLLPALSSVQGDIADTIREV